MSATAQTFTELNAELITGDNADLYLPGGKHASDRYCACIYCGSEEVCCGTPGHDDCHCPACHQKDREEGEWAGCRDDGDDYCDVPPEADGDTEDPRFSPYARLALI